GCGRRVDVEAAGEGGNLRRYVLLAERNRAPLEALACKRKSVALFGPRKEEYKCFVGSKQPLHLFGGRRLRVCECGIVGEFPVDPCDNCVKPPLGLGYLPAQGVDPRLLPPTLRVRKRIQQCLVLLAPGGGEVLALAHQGSQSAGTRGEARAHLLDCRRG